MGGLRRNDSHCAHFEVKIEYTLDSSIYLYHICRSRMLEDNLLLKIKWFTFKFLCDQKAFDRNGCFFERKGLRALIFLERLTIGFTIILI